MIYHFRTLTRREMAAMPPSVRAARIEHWRRVIAALQDDHWRRYPDVMRRGWTTYKTPFPVDRPPLEDFDGVGATLARGFRESA